MELLKMSNQQIVNLMRKEIDVINSLKIPVIEVNKYYDYKNKEEVIDLMSSKELIRLHKEQKSLLDNEEIKYSKVYKFNTNKIESYNDLIDFWIIKNKKIVKHNTKYDNYKKEISKLFNVNNCDGQLKDFLEYNNIKVSLEFYVNYRQKDIDNITKPFIDCLFHNVNVSDNNIKEINSKVLKSESKSEYILFKIETINKKSMEHSFLLNEYLIK